MFETIITSIISFASTNIDDIFVLMIFYTQVNERLRNRDIIIGQYLGIGILVILSIIGAVGVNFIPEKYIGLLGLLPILLGIKTWLDSKKEKAADTLQTVKHTVVDIDKTIKASKIKSILEKVIKPEILSVILITIANGADNIGIYVPVFGSYSLWQFVVTIAVFIVMIAIWCFAGYKLANYPLIKARLQKYKYVLVPVVYVSLGIFIILRSGVLGVLFG